MNNCPINRQLIFMVLQQGKEAFIYKFAAPAVEGFVRSISLSRGSSLQDTLRLLTLWFDYGQYTDVYDAIVSGLNRIEIDTWLQVIPQLIARIDTPRALVSILIHQLLMDIGKNHPQVYIDTTICHFVFVTICTIFSM